CLTVHGRVHTVGSSMVTSYARVFGPVRVQRSTRCKFLARAPIIGFRTEVGHIDDEGIALPVAARVAVPLADIGRQVRAPVHDDIPLPPLPLAHVVEHRDAAGGLHDLPEAPAERGSKFGQAEGQAAISQPSVLWTVIAIDARGAVARWKLCE